MLSWRLGRGGHASQVDQVLKRWKLRMTILTELYKKFELNKLL
jgi:hypothetical protein